MADKFGALSAYIGVKKKFRSIGSDPTEGEYHAETVAVVNTGKPNGAHTSNSTLSAAVTLTRPTNATRLRIQAFTQNVRYTLDGTTPTATVGFQIKAADPATVIDVAGVTSVKVIEEAASANIQYQWLD